jgi:hypothetical protein
MLAFHRSRLILPAHGARRMPRDILLTDDEAPAREAR